MNKNEKMVRHDFPYQSNYAEVFGSKIHYVDTGGSGSVVVMIHGHPTWSYLWRNIIPHLEESHRVIALDLIGFGKSDAPDIEYTAIEQSRYLIKFMEVMQLHDITLVLHDWGGILGFDYAANHPNNIKAIAFMETMVWVPPAETPYTIQPKALINPKNESFGLREFFDFLAQIKTPGVGEKMMLEDNIFIDQIVIPSLTDMLTEDELNAYRDPFTRENSRKASLQFHRDVPSDGKPEYILQMMMKYNNYLQTQPILPKLLLHLSEGYILIDRWAVEWMRNNLPDIEVHNMGPGNHFMQEFNPEGIGQAISLWMDKNNL